MTTIVSAQLQGMPGPPGGVSPAELLGLQAGWRYSETLTQNASDTPSSSSGSTYADVMVQVVTLPTGTWTVELVGEFESRNTSEAAQTFGRVTIAGEAGTPTSPGHAAGDGYQTIRARHKKTGLTGQVVLRLQGHPHIAQTAFFRMPKLTINYTRTA